MSGLQRFLAEFEKIAGDYEWQHTDAVFHNRSVLRTPCPESITGWMCPLVATEYRLSGTIKNWLSAGFGLGMTDTEIKDTIAALDGEDNEVRRLVLSIIEKTQLCHA